MIVTVVLYGGVNPAVEYGFEEAVDGSVALNPCGLKTHGWAVEQGVVSPL